METLPCDAIYQIAMRIGEPVDLLNFSSVNKRILNLCDDYKIWKKHAKKFLNIDIPNSRKKYLEYASKNKEVDDFLLNQFESYPKEESIEALLELIEDTATELSREAIRVQDILLYDTDYIDWKLFETMENNKDYIRELPEKINLILDGGNLVDKKYNLYQIVLVLSDKFAEALEMF